MRRLIHIALALLLVITAQQVAQARGAAIGQLAVICGPSGLMAVALDVQGQPVGQGHYCPDGMMALATPAPSPAMPPAPLRLAVIAWAAPVLGWMPKAPLRHAAARGPPTLV